MIQNKFNNYARVIA